ncbi:MAG: hypothetical protein ABJA79_03695 [Parafilimonas sp.]
MEKELRIRAFRAPNDPETCRKYIIGHRKVLENHGINKVTSSTEDWVNSTCVFVVVVETMNGEKLYGGVRIHAYEGENFLPMQEAIADMDSRIHYVIQRYAANGTGELCGLWNSLEVAGLGIGSLFPIRAGIVIAEQAGLNSLFFLCSPLTVRFNKWVGSRIITEIGNEGTFYYPKLDLLATAVVLEDAITVEHAHPREKQKIFFMRNNLNFTTVEKSPFKNVYVTVHYDLTLADIKMSEFSIQ